MKSFACGDVVPGCESRWVCSTEDEILVSVAGHAAAAHGLTELSPELVHSVRRSIASVS